MIKFITILCTTLLSLNAVADGKNGDAGLPGRSGSNGSNGRSTVNFIPLNATSSDKDSLNFYNF